MSVVRRSTCNWATALLLGASALVAVQGTAQASSAEPGQVDDARLAGFASAGVPVTEARAGWTVPELDCQATPTGEASILISMGKAGHQNLVSIGMTAACEDGAAVYSSWYKIPGRLRSDCPGGPPVAGQQVRAQMDAIGNVDLSMTACASIMTDQSVSDLTSASFVIRATRPAVGQPVQPLANFGTVYVTSAQVNDTSIADVSNVNWRMVDKDGTVRAVTAGLHDNGSFAVNWRAAH